MQHNQLERDLLKVMVGQTIVYRGLLLVDVLIGGFRWNGKTFTTQEELDAEIDKTYQTIDKSIIKKGEPK